MLFGRYRRKKATANKKNAIVIGTITLIVLPPPPAIQATITLVVSVTIKTGTSQALPDVEIPMLQLPLFGNMDVLLYAYQSRSNKLVKVLDNGNDNYRFKDGSNITTEYTYDQNGNMISDANKNITNILYNHLNMPTQVDLKQKVRQFL